ncbi:MAG: hypothetical protein KJ990_12670 [Proteobacteria bacterium]|nr:hypothetical protein [Pseudomonadota bacterium]MBU1648209.1 hypothetical protein [Pseudomonadota bacterium]
MKIDRKFKFVATNPCKGNVYTEQNAMIFCAKDKALIPTLQAYYVECARLGCGNEHLESIELLMERVKIFQAVGDEEHRHIPDTETDCEIDRCIGGKGL